MLDRISSAPASSHRARRGRRGKGGEMSNFLWGSRGHCPKCGKFCADITATINELEGVKSVTGKCKKHQAVDLTNQEWSWEDFVREEKDLETK